MTSPKTCVTGLDHVGFIVQDLQASGDLVAQLGFCQTVRANHTRTNSAGELVSAGSSQRSVMLHGGYIEFMQITDPAAGHQLTPATSVRHGLHVLALGTDDAAACRDACMRAHVAVGPLLRWARLVREADIHGEARFCYFDSRWDPQDPSYVCWVQHLTPELLRSPRLLAHDNCAMALTGVVYRGSALLAQRWIAQLLQAGALMTVTRADGATLLLPGARLEVHCDETLATVVPVALVLAFSDLTWMRERCRVLRLPVRETEDGSLDIDLEHAFGMHWICTAGVSQAAAH